MMMIKNRLFRWFRWRPVRYVMVSAAPMDGVQLAEALRVGETDRQFLAVQQLIREAINEAQEKAGDAELPAEVCKGYAMTAESFRVFRDAILDYRERGFGRVKEGETSNVQRSTFNVQ